MTHVVSDLSVEKLKARRFWEPPMPLTSEITTRFNRPDLRGLGSQKGIALKASLTVITLGMDDLERSLRFYREGLGLKTEGIIGTEFEHGAVVFFELNSGLKLAIWPRKSLAHDSGLPLNKPSATELSLGHNVSSKAEVDAVMKQAKQAGARIVKPAQQTFWGGYAGYFQDPDLHLWEVVWNPHWEAED